MINASGPCVLFATPGMISGGFSLEAFKQWAPYKENLITLPGYCVAGTIGHKLMSGKPTKIILDDKTQVDVRCQIHQLSFSPHTDSKGIMDLVKFLSPKHVILVHGEKPKMTQLKGKIQSELGIPCYVPANSETVSIPSTQCIKADASDAFLKSSMIPHFKFSNTSGANPKSMDTSTLKVCDVRVGEGVLIMEKGKKAKVVHHDELLKMLGEKQHEVCFAHCCPVQISNSEELINSDQISSTEDALLQLLLEKLSNQPDVDVVQDCGDHLQGGSFRVSICLKDKCPFRTGSCGNETSETIYFCCSWAMEDENLAWRIISILKTLKLSNTHRHSEGPYLRSSHNLEADHS